MPDINDEMNETANYAVKLAREMFGQELDFTDQSVEKLENVLWHIYQSFSSLPPNVFTPNEKIRIEISQTANIWGSYLGEFMCLKWVGNWIKEDLQQLISIDDITFSPINWVYQKITSHPESKVGEYLLEVERLLTEEPEKLQVEIDYVGGVNPLEIEEEETDMLPIEQTTSPISSCNKSFFKWITPP